MSLFFIFYPGQAAVDLIFCPVIHFTLTGEEEFYTEVNGINSGLNMNA